MKLIFELTSEDLIALNKSALKSTTRHRIIVILIILTVYTIYFVYNQYSNSDISSRTTILIPIAVLAFLGTKFFINSPKKAVSRAIKLNPNIIGNRTYEFSVEELRIHSNNENTTYRPNSFIKMNETAEHYFLFNSKVTAVVIPKRALTTHEEENYISSWIKNFDNEV